MAVKGIVFVKFNEFIEELWGEEFWDTLLDEANLPSEGIYTTVGTYDDQELFTLVGLVVEKQNISAKDAQFAFGKWVFKELFNAAPAGAHDFKDVFEFLHAVQDFIHVEVKKLNPDALLPEFEFLSETPTTLSFHYQSPRKLCYFCEGIVYGLAEHTGQKIAVSQTECEHQGDQRCVLEVVKV
ncbi:MULTISPECIES: heme NO-binding domain-containing protein [Aliiglaciecola]|uniref:heme NO-binding domain-containing protein n=1 Tax=Aliiglaciecola TaxID=1406885 RepID=UPI0020916E14|nr:MULTISPECIES: heme NO-binding domain-containing protein [Aliiglaciecola]MDO6712904.1 heme NO-binding domain-containing protein [Aliiglaciecola sp. 2_MG-2023]MDO6752860.1 heme NO-binding domain-containing protein [Aliiglaciecola sp. 1_MG-2023]